MEDIQKLMIKLSKTTAFWNILNGSISLLVVEVSGLPYESVPLILAWLSFLTKMLNKKFNPHY